jgi:hypothetical protein
MNVTGNTTLAANGGRVGIGKTSTAYALDVSGTMNVRGESSLANASVSGTLNVTGDTTLARNGGRVGIGKTSTAYALDVSGTMNVMGESSLANASVSGTLNVTGETTFMRTNGTPLLRIQSNIRDELIITPDTGSYLGTNRLDQFTSGGQKSGSSYSLNADFFIFMNFTFLNGQRYIITVTLKADTAQTDVILNIGDGFNKILTRVADQEYKTYSIVHTIGTITDINHNLYMRGTQAQALRSINLKHFSIEPLLPVYDATLDVVGDRVGIGTNNPQYALDVSGTMNVRGGTSLAGTTNINTTGTSVTTVTGTTNINTNGTGLTTIGNDKATTLVNGKLGIGTSAPAYSLDVSGTMNVSFLGDSMFKITALIPYVTLSDTDIQNLTTISESIFASGPGSNSKSFNGDSYDFTFYNNDLTFYNNHFLYRFGETYSLGSKQILTIRIRFVVRIETGNSSFKVDGTDTKFMINTTNQEFKTYRIPFIGTGISIRLYIFGYVTAYVRYFNVEPNYTYTNLAENGSPQSRVGIGKSTPTQTLDVNGTVSATSYATVSDRRIKNNIVDVEDDRALRDLRRLKPKTYTYRDTEKRGTEPVYGFIAQEVKEVLDYASYPVTDVVPNIYEMATFQEYILTLTFNTADLARYPSGDLFTRLKVKTREGKDEYVNILEVIDEHTMRVDKDLTEWGQAVEQVEDQVPVNRIFVYGQEVNDFHTLNKDAIWTVSTAALQEVDRQLQSEKQKVLVLQEALTSVLEKVDTLVAKVETLEQRPA